MAIVKTDKKYRHGLTTTFPGIVGKQTPDKETGELELDDDKAAYLVKYVPDFYIKGDPDSDPELKPKEEQTVTTKPAAAPAVHEDVKLSDDEKQELINSLQDLTRKDLEGQCEQFPSKGWRGKNKEDLIKYLTEKILA